MLEAKVRVKRNCQNTTEINKKLDKTSYYCIIFIQKNRRHVIRTTCRSYVEFFESFEYSSGVKNNTKQGWINCSFSRSGGQITDVYHVD